ncbi:MAG: hypothetical protein MUF64_11225 [Polyangiaceae bacterium]|jgi:hypothetical protein|nr:hypothetical protein [Polyangiaceae bacterium]
MPQDRLHQLAEARSLELHRQIAERLQENPSLTERARANVERWSADKTLAPAYAQRWRKALSLPLSELIDLLLDPGEEACSLRQTTPFSFVISPRERWKIWREVRSTWSPEP